MINHPSSPLSKQRNKSGFTLLEVLVSGAVLSVVLLALVMLLSYNIKSDDQARNRVVASELTQEGTDFFRQARNVLGFSGLTDTLSDGTYCLQTLPNMTAVPLENYLSSSPSSCEGYNLNWERTDYKREALVVKLQDQIDITVTVSWLSSNGEVSTSSQMRLRKR